MKRRIKIERWNLVIVGFKSDNATSVKQNALQICTYFIFFMKLRFRLHWRWLWLCCTRKCVDEDSTITNKTSSKRTKQNKVQPSCENLGPTTPSEPVREHLRAEPLLDTSPITLDQFLRGTRSEERRRA